MVGFPGLTANNNREAKNTMTKTLNDIATRTSTDSTVLKKVVELALYNESLYGLNDFARVCKVNHTSLLPERTLDTLFELTLEEKQNIRAQSIDDRTM